jgi:biopolymer transport protein ExbD
MRLSVFLFTLFSALNIYAVLPPAQKNTTYLQFAEKILLITLDDVGTITVNKDPVSSEILSSYIQERLFKSYLGTGQMHSRIKLEKANKNVPEILTQTIIKEIKDGQRKALISVCLQKYKKTFDGLEKKKQDKMIKQFPVLFQTDF